jgi:hypothetical protein
MRTVTKKIDTQWFDMILSGKEFWFDKYEGWICSGGGPKADPEKLKILAEKLRVSQK